MPSEEDRVFRKRALQHYLHERDEAVIPRLIAPAIFARLWALVALLLIVTIVCAGFFKMPVYVPGVAAITHGKCGVENDCKTLMVVALLPPESLPDLHVGQTIYLDQSRHQDRLQAVVIKVEPAVKSPEDIRKRFAIDGPEAQAMNHPAAVAIAQWNGENTYAGSMMQIEVKSGSRRILSLLAQSGKGSGH